MLREMEEGDCGALGPETERSFANHRCVGGRDSQVLFALCGMFVAGTCVEVEMSSFVAAVVVLFCLAGMTYFSLQPLHKRFSMLLLRSPLV
jgi:hypothetical protein